jgi:hypothetical protein
VTLSPPPLLPPPLPAAAPTRVVNAAVGLAGYSVATFTADARAAFVRGTAASLAVAPAALTITSVADYTIGSGTGRRRLLDTGVTVGFSVAAADGATAAALSAAITSVLADNPAVLVSALQAAGLSGVTGAEATVAPSIAVATPAAATPAPTPPALTPELYASSTSRGAALAAALIAAALASVLL